MQARRFQNVAVLMGGPSAERDVSLRSGTAVAHGLRLAGYTASGIELDGSDFQLAPGTEAVFIALHGTYGEDGNLQELLNRSGVPYTGSGARASRVAFDKLLSKQEFERAGIASPRYAVVKSGDTCPLAFPAVVKPRAQGSSIGVRRVDGEADWPAALECALEYGPDALVEEYVPGRELTIGIVERSLLPVVEIVAPDDWYGYDAKYTSGTCRYVVPARIDESTARSCRETALRVFDTLDCRGLARVDFRCPPGGAPVVLEINTIPGFTETSLLPKAAAEAGIEFADLCHRIMQTACTDRNGAGQSAPGENGRVV